MNIWSKTTWYVLWSSKRYVYDLIWNLDFEPITVSKKGVLTLIELSNSKKHRQLELAASLYVLI